VKAGLLFINRERKPKFSGGIWKSVAPGQNRSNGFSFLKKERLYSILKRGTLLSLISECQSLPMLEEGEKKKQTFT